MTTPTRYRKKPVTINAMQYDGANTYDIIDWIDQNTPLGQGAVLDPEDDTVCIQTLEGIMSASIGDWIIRGVADEFYPCKPDIFKKTYELAEESQVFVIGDLDGLPNNTVVKDNHDDIGIIMNGNIYYPETAVLTVKYAKRFGPFTVLLTGATK